MAEQHPNKIVYIFNQNSGLKLTYSDVKERACLLAKNLMSLNLRKGDRIAYLMPNTYELLISYYAAAIIGLISVPLDSDYGSDELEYMLNKTSPKAVIVYNCSEYQSMINDLFPEIKTCSKENFKSKKFKQLDTVILIDEHEKKLDITFKGGWSYEFLSTEYIEDFDREFPYVDSDDELAILFTSGTTSRPKGIIETHFCLLNNINIVSNYKETLYVNDHNGSISCQTLLMYHMGAMHTIFSCLFRSDLTIVFPSYKLSIPDILTSIEKYKCTSLSALPKILQNILNYEMRKNYNLSNLRTILSGGQTVTAELMKRLKNEMNIKTCVIGFGMTEIKLLTLNVIELNEFQFDNYNNMLGEQYPLLEAKIVNPENGHLQPLNNEGELHVRGYCVTRGYYNDEEMTRNLIDANGWLNTGDVLSMDENGCFYYKSRSKEVITVKGSGRIDVYPSNVEDCLLSYYKVNEAIVFGILINDYESELCAWIKLHDCYVDNTQVVEIINYCRDKLVDYKIPKYIKFVNHFAVSKMGKYLRSEMSRLYKAELGL